MQEQSSDVYEVGSYICQVAYESMEVLLKHKKEGQMEPTLVQKEDRIQVLKLWTLMRT